MWCGLMSSHAGAFGSLGNLHEVRVSCTLLVLMGNFFFGVSRKWRKVFLLGNLAFFFKFYVKLSEN